MPERALRYCGGEKFLSYFGRAAQLDRPDLPRQRARRVRHLVGFGSVDEKYFCSAIYFAHRGIRIAFITRLSET